MVLKTFIQYLINKYLKHYIERFDHEKVKLSLKSGNIFLEHLRLKPEALAYLNIPATVAVGYLEQLRVTIPWNNLSTNPTEVHIDGLYLLIVPKNEMSQDLSKHHADKSKRVEQKLENLRKAALSDGTSDNKDHLAFVERMRYQVMKNLVIKIRNLHICYEMKTPTKLGHPFSFGITLHYLEVTTANNVNRTKGNKLLTYRIKEINSISMYWNPKCQSRLNMSFDDVVNDLKSKTATYNYTPNDPEMKYILYPINLTTESIITLKPKEHHYERSAMTFNIQIPQINLHVDSEQISDVLDFLKFQNYTTVYDRCREYRTLLLQSTKELTQTQKQRIQFLESKLDIFQLAYIRHRVEIEGNRFVPILERNESVEEQQEKTNTDHQDSRWSSWSKVKNSFNSFAKNYRKTSATTTDSAQNVRRSFFEDLPHIEIEVNFHNLDLNFLAPKSNNVRFAMNGYHDQTIACISVSNARVNMKKMGITSRVECMIQMESLQMFGMGRDNEHRSLLLTPMSSLSSSPVLHVEFELFAAKQKSDYRFNMIMEPIRFIYHAPTINQLVECFEANGALVWQQKPEIQQWTTVELEENLLYEKILEITINLKGVSVILPECGILQQGFPLIRINFGNLTFKSCLDDSDDNVLFKANERRFYTKYKLELSDLRIFYSDSNRKRFYILRRTPLIDINFYKCIYLNDANLTNWFINVKIALGDIQLSKTSLMKLILHLNSLPLFYTNINIIIKRINFYFIIFQPHESLISDLSIYNCCLRFLMYPKISIRTDLHLNIGKTRDENGTHTYANIEFQEPNMIQHLLSEVKQSSRLLYENKHIKLIYSDLDTTL